MSAQPKILEPAPPPISDEERAKRKFAVETAYANNAIEGVPPNPITAPIFEAFVNGEFDLPELGPRLRAALKVG